MTKVSNMMRLLPTLRHATKIPDAGDRGMWFGGTISGYSNTMDYITISSTSNATDFGDLSTGKASVSSTSNGITGKGVVLGGADATVTYNAIEYVSIMSPADAQDFGDLLNKVQGSCGTSNGSQDRGINSGGYDTLYANYIEYITISSNGDAEDFGDLSVATQELAGCDNGTYNRSITSGGAILGNVEVNTIDYTTINSLSDSQDFGDLLLTTYNHGTCSNKNSNRGIFASSYADNVSNQISHITISSTSNAQDFGDLSIAKHGHRGTSNGINNRGVFGGGEHSQTPWTRENTIDYISIHSLGNSVDFGDLIEARYNTGATSNA